MPGWLVNRFLISWVHWNRETASAQASRPGRKDQGSPKIRPEEALKRLLQGQGAKPEDYEEED